MKEDRFDYLDYRNEDTVICPYCKHDNGDDPDFGEIKMEEKYSRECAGCEKEFEVEWSCDIKFTSFKIKDNA